jgi:RNA polymerase sigma-70 factor (ECF subfamily)
LDVISNADQLVDACLRDQPFAWQKLVDEYAAVVVLAVRQLGDSTGRAFVQSDIDRLTREVFEQIRANHYALLATFDRSASLETFMVVVARRVVQASTNRGNPA